MEFFLGKKAVIRITVNKTNKPDVLAMELMNSIKKLVKAGASNGGEYGFSFSED